METPGISPQLAANFKMIDIGEKKDTQRRAVASGVFFASPETISRISNRTLPKGDVLVLAEVAGIQGAKGTSNLLPLCHPLSLTSVRVWTELSQTNIRVFCEVKTVGKTGVEMEALCGVNAALLCIYDLTKGIDPVLEMGDIRLEIKEGGKSGQWSHPRSQRASSLLSSQRSTYSHASLKGIVSVIVTLSDRCSKKEYEDQSGPTISHWLEAQGAILKNSIILPDDRQELRSYLLNLLQKDPPDVIITNGGTGLSQRDITPETLLEVSQKLGGREIPGIGELLRQSGSRYTQNSWLSRSLAVLIEKTLIVCLPGSPSAVLEGLHAIGPLIRHVLHIRAGGDHHLNLKKDHP